MKILILGFTKIRYMPYLNLYLDEIDTKKDEVHLLYWARDNKADSPVPENVIGHSFDVPMDDSIPLSKKLPIILKYGSFAKKQIKKLAPDFLIVLHATTAFTIRKCLLRRYRGRYLFDYRDLTYENRFGFYGKAIKKIAECSVATFTSSDGFRAVLPDNGRVYTSHNIMSDAEELHNQFKGIERKGGHPIRVAFWGLLRHYEINQQIIEKLCRDERFEVHYYGRAQGRMLNLMEESGKKYKNFAFHGEYTPQERIAFARDTDLILNLYDNRGTILYAMGNKYYDGVVFCIPQLCTAGTYMGKKCAEAGVGLACDPYNDSFADTVSKYYDQLDRTAFERACDAELTVIMNQVKEDKEIIKGALTNG